VSGRSCRVRRHLLGRRRRGGGARGAGSGAGWSVRRPQRRRSLAPGSPVSSASMSQSLGSLPSTLSLCALTSRGVRCNWRRVGNTCVSMVFSRSSRCAASSATASSRSGVRAATAGAAAAAAMVFAGSATQSASWTASSTTGPACLARSWAVPPICPAGPGDDAGDLHDADHPRNDVPGVRQLLAATCDALGRDAPGRPGRERIDVGDSSHGPLPRGGGEAHGRPGDLDQAGDQPQHLGDLRGELDGLPGHVFNRVAHPVGADQERVEVVHGLVH